MPKNPAPSQPATPPAPHHRDEPEITQEESVPSDGRDTEGEQAMKEVRNHKLHDEGSAEHKTPAKTDKRAQP